jgi:4-hydroxy-tetrahydrodipicolinate reductase
MILKLLVDLALILWDIVVGLKKVSFGMDALDEIAVMALRGGDIVGEHTVGFYNDGEFLRLSHTATSRDTFAKGAVKAAAWLAAQKPGLYKIQDCLGI